jgi:hypothetical protein
MTKGAKEALRNGGKFAVRTLSVKDGFYGNSLFRIKLPKEVENIKSTLVKVGLKKDVKRFELSLNRAAEKATRSAIDIFVSAIQIMTVRDVINLIQSDDSAITNYLKRETSLSLRKSFSPIVKKSLDSVKATYYWKKLASKYDQLPFVKRVRADLIVYVTDNALKSLFYQISKEEVRIKENPVARTSELLKRVFAQR